MVGTTDTRARFGGRRNTIDGGTGLDTCATLTGNTTGSFIATGFADELPIRTTGVTEESVIGFTQWAGWG